MEITGSNRKESSLINELQLVQGLDQDRRKTKASQRRELGSDEAIISDKGQLLQHLSEAVRNAPDIRTEKIAKLREAIESGKYKVSAEELAKALLASRVI